MVRAFETVCRVLERPVPEHGFAVDGLRPMLLDKSDAAHETAADRSFSGSVYIELDVATVYWTHGGESLPEITLVTPEYEMSALGPLIAESATPLIRNNSASLREEFAFLVRDDSVRGGAFTIGASLSGTS